MFNADPGRRFQLVNAHQCAPSDAAHWSAGAGPRFLGRRKRWFIDVLASLHSLRETIAILSDPDAVAQIRDSEAEIAAGRLTDAEDLREAMIARRPNQA